MPTRPSSFATAPVAAIALALLTGSAHAGDLRGRIELTDLGAFTDPTSLDASLGAEDRNDVLGDLRIMYEPRWDNWDFSFAYRLSADVGRGVELARDTAALMPPKPPATLFDLTQDIVNTDHALVTQKIDRLSLGYSSGNFVARVGRQALTWGAGTVFHPMDLVDPFAPETVDTEYKPGVDMAYVQMLFDDGSDLQAIAVPRRATPGGPVSLDASTLALHYHRTLGDIGLTAILARDHGDWTAGLGLSGALGGAVWNAELVPTLLPNGTLRTSGLVNISGATTIFDRNATLFAEYFHNGFGAANGSALDALPADLVDRLSRGQVFNTSRNYLAAGLSLEWTPLFTFSPSVILNLDDKSLDLAAEANWSLNDNLNLIAGVQVPVGPSGTEFGGLPVSGGGAPYAEPPTTAYMQLRQYF